MSQQTPMSLSKLVRRSLAHYRGTNLAVLAGVALTSAILSGALVVGDSVRESLRRNAEARLSQVGPVLIGGERFFSEALGERLGEQLGEAEVAPLLLVEGTASARKTGQRLNRVQLIGVTDAFWKLSISGEVPPGSNESDWIGVNETLAKRLDSTVGDTLITRFELPSALSRDAPLSGESEQTLPFTAKIAKVLGPEEHGLFSLRAEQIPPATIYLPLSRLQEVVEQPDRVNLLLASRGVSAADFSAVVESSWDLSDLRLYLKPVEDAGAEGKQILSDRVFFSPAVAEGIFEAIPDSSPVLTYLAVTIRSGDRETPYSMVTGVSPNLNQIVSADLPDDGVILSDWIADDLEAAVGDPIEMEFFVVGRGRELEYQNAEFTVASVAPLDEAGWGKSWTPEFPGIFDVEDLDDWEPGIPIDRSRIRDKDDEYWDDHRATPKAFISLARARQLWGNRFGENTAIRVPASVTEMSLREGLREQISLSDVGIVTRDLAAEAEAAVANSYDFGTLFASMSFFLIIAALTLTGLLLVFGIEQRASQIGLLLALGWSRRKVRLVFIAEALLVSVIGAFLGLLGGYLYTRLALAGMSGVWSDAAAGIEFVYQLSPTSLLAAFFITVSVALVVAWIAARRIGAVQPSALIGGTGNPLAGGTAFWKKKRLRWDWIIFILGLLGGIGSLLAPKTPGTIAEQGLFFGAGFWLVAAGVAAASIILRRTLRPGRGLPSISVLGRQQAARRRGRSLAVIGLMAAGVFMVSAINSFRLDGSRGADRRGSGTGGFAYVGEATLPIYEDLNTVGGREKYGLDSVPSGFEVVSFRASNGEDASCLNLNRAQRPRLLGVDPDRLAELGAFTFTQNSDSQKEGWSGLDLTPTRTDPAVPVIAGIIDQSTAIYALGISSVGSRLQYETVSGAAFEVEIVGFLDTSILQGSVIISEENFIEQFPDSGGYQLLLIDGSDATPSGELDSTANALSRMFAARGLELRPASDKLNEFNAVQNTYLSIFSTLGGLGILLGTIGLAIVVGRNVLERRGELGVMQAVGFDRGQLGRLILSEHWFLHVSGVLLGLGAALVAVLPRLGAGMSPGTWGLLLGINAAVLAGGLVFCWLASRWTTQGNLTEAIRTE